MCFSAAFGVRTAASAQSRSRAHRRRQSSGDFPDQPRNPATDALTHRKPVNTLSTRYRVDRRIVDLPNYSRGQKYREFTPRRDLYENEPLKRARSVCEAERFDIAKSRRTRFTFIGFKSQLIPDTCRGSQCRENDTNEQVDIQIMGHLFTVGMQSMN